MLTKIEIENRDGLCLLKYVNPTLPQGKDEKKLAHVEKAGELTYKGYFGSEDDILGARDALKALIRDLNATSEQFVVKKHANVYAYVDNYLTTRNPIYPIPRRKKISELFSKKSVYVDVCDTVYRRSRQGKDSYVAYGRVDVCPTGDVGVMSLKLDSRSLCAISNVRYETSARVRREGVTTFIVCPAAATTVMSYSFQCNEKDFPDVSLLLNDAQALELQVCPPERCRLTDFKAELFFEYPPGEVSVSPQEGKARYEGGARTVFWEIGEMTRKSLLSIRTAMNHKGSLAVKYSYHMPKASASNIIISSLSSDADENWIRRSTRVGGILRLSE